MPEFDLSRDEFRDVEPPAVVRLTAPVDAPKPLAAYSALRTEYSFLLESAETDISALKQVGAGGNGGDGRARYSSSDTRPTPSSVQTRAA